MILQVSVPFIFVLICLIHLSKSYSLYSPDDPLHELDSSNFKSVVFHKNHAWIIEFYLDWCGHCKRYAPKWKHFARDTRTWRNIVDVAVVNCADKQNVELCRDFNIQGYPTLQVFGPHVNESTKGIDISGIQVVESVESSLTDFLESSHDKNGSPHWPVLQPLKFHSVKEVTNLLKDNEGSVILLVEHSDSSLGKKVILDLSFQSAFIVRRVLMTNSHLVDDLKTDIANASLITVLKIDKSGREEVLFRFSADNNATYIRNQIFLKIVGTPKGDSEKLVESNTNTKIEVSIRDSVNMVDLENAIHYMLYQEIGGIKHLYGTRYLAFQDILSMLLRYFPGKPHVMGYLKKLNSTFTEQRNITGEEFVQTLDSLQTPSEYLPEMTDFVSCKGSEPRYRGYPCSLWTLFHTLTVNALITDEQTSGAFFTEAMSVLPCIKKYIFNFFTCQECVENFGKMDQNIERDDSTTGNVVLWLWTAHNKVNHRLSGDVTEDPKHPKIQFPSSDMCPKCRLSNEDPASNQWDDVQVLRFLRQFYSKQHIVGSDEYHSSGGSPSSMVISLQNVSIYERWRFQWFTNTDISLCVSLYMVSALLLVLIFLLFRQRRKRRKSQMFNYFMYA